VFHGNNKPERIKLHSSGTDGFFYNGNFLILYKDDVIKKRKNILGEDDPEKNYSPPQSKVYLPDKEAPGSFSKKITDSIK
jgi:hypothetical protein